MLDEREEMFRQICALGNTKAAQHFIHAGVKVNSQNKMNGWTCLHWASHRGQEDIVRLLLSNGADASIKTAKGQTPLDLCNDKYPGIQTLLESQNVERTSIGPEPSLPIVPAYMKEPDLEKSWLLPDEFSENKVERVIRQEKAKDLLAKDVVNDPQGTQQTKPEAPKPSVDLAGTEEKEILVYSESRSDDTIIGSIYVKNEELEKIVSQLKEELDGLPEEFALARHNGKVKIPISKKQMTRRALDIFRDDDDVLVIVSSSNPSV